MSRNERSVLMLVPSWRRDLEGHVLVAFQIEHRHGYEVKLCFGDILEEDLFAASPDVVVLDYLGWDTRVRIAQLAGELGIRTAILPTAGFFQDEERELRRAGHLIGAASLANRYLTWGEAGRNLLIREGRGDREQVHTTGCPRFDFYREPFLRLMSSRQAFLERLGAAPAHPVVLWTTNGYFAHCRDGKAEVRRQAKQARRPVDELTQEIEDSKTQFREHSALMMELAKRNPDWNVLVKVHPFEPVDPYQEMAARVKNLYVAEVPIREALYHADVVLQRGCTTATEAWMLGKPVIELMAGHYHHPIRADVLGGNEPVKDIEGAEHAIRGALAGHGISAAQKEARERFIGETYYRIDGRAAERCADRIAELVAPPVYSDEDRLGVREATRRAELNWRRREDSRLTNRLKDLLGVDRRVSLRFWRGLARGTNLGLRSEPLRSSPERVSEIGRLYETYAGLYETGRVGSRFHGTGAQETVAVPAAFVGTPGPFRG
jgi:surface carbohydrate biosynthesis protein